MESVAVYQNGNGVKLTPSKDRRRGLGGSDMGAVLGIDTFRTPYDVWDAKVNGTKTEVNHDMEVGTYLEPFIADKFAKKMNAKVWAAEAMMTHPHYDYFYGSIDRFYELPNGENGVLECKYTTKYIDEPSPSHFIQVQWYLMITGMNYAYIAYSLPHDFKIFPIKADLNFQQMLINKGVEFWTNYVQTKTPPPAVNLNDIKEIYKTARQGACKLATEEVKGLILNIAKLKAQIHNYEKMIENLQLPLFEFFAENDTIVDEAGETIATWKQTTTNRFNTKDFQKDYPELYEQYLTQSFSRRKYFKEWYNLGG